MDALEIVIKLNELQSADDDDVYFMASEIGIPFPIDLKNYATFVYLDDDNPRLVLRPRRK